MRIIVSGMSGLVITHEELGFTAALITLLRTLGHEADILTEPGHCDLFVALSTGETPPELLQTIQDFIEAEVPVLYLTDPRMLVTSDFLVAADQIGMIQIVCYRDFDDLGAKVLKYAAHIAKYQPKVLFA